MIKFMFETEKVCLLIILVLKTKNEKRKERVKNRNTYNLTVRRVPGSMDAIC